MVAHGGSPSAIGVVARILGASGLAGRSLAALGGSSLDAARAAQAVREECGLAATGFGLLHTDDVAEYLEALPALAPVESKGSAFSPGDLVPLTWQQRVVWYQSLLDPQSPRYHFHALFAFEQAPDLALLNQAFRDMARRHPVLLTRLAYRAGEPFQVFPDLAAADRLGVETAQLPEPPATEAELVELAGANRAFDLEVGPLVRWTLVGLPAGRSVLIHTEHHLVHDGVSFTTLVDGLAGSGAAAADEAYFSYAARPSAPVEAARVADELAAQDYAALSPRQVEGETDPHLRLPLPADLFAAVRTVAAEAGVTAFIVLFAAFAEAVTRIHGPIALATAVANRPAGCDDAVGMFVSTVPVFVEDGAGMSVRAAAAAIDAAVRRADIPVTDLAAALGAHTADRHGPLAAVFSLHEQRTDRLLVAGAPATLTPGVFPGAAKFPVNAVALVTGADGSAATLLLESMIEYCDRDGLWSTWREFVSCLAGLCAGALAPRPAEERDGVADALHAAAREFGSAVALRDAEGMFSYADLSALGAVAAGCVAGAVVGLFGLPSARFFAAECAMLLGGATFVPLGADQPAERLREMARLAGCTVVLDLDGASDVGFSDEIARLTWDQFTAMAPATGKHTTPDVAYVMFTSGSTGVPKGVRVRSSALARLCAWGAAELGLKPGTVTSQIANVGFDASVWEVWPALCAGATVVVAPREVRADAFALAHWLAVSDVEVAFAATPIAEMLLGLDWTEATALRVLGAGGEQLHLPGKALPFRLMNLYGPTECTVVAVAGWVDPRSSEPAPIGTPLPYITARVVCEDGSLILDDREGELWLGGGAVAAGYCPAPDATSSRFIPDPYSMRGDLVYRTGDVVRMRPDGTLSFHGRRDRQIKVSGVRVELAEIEAIALRVPEVRHAVATAFERAGRSTGLALVVVARPGADERALSQRIRAALPPYLRHLLISFVAEIPLMSSGKVDMARLSQAAGAPGGPDALKVAVEVLGTDQLDSSWFQLGGSSLDAARTVTWLAKDFGVFVSLRDLLEASSVAACLAQARREPIGAAPESPQAALAVPPPAKEYKAEAASATDVLWPALSSLPVRDRLHLAARLVESAAEAWTS